MKISSPNKMALMVRPKPSAATLRRISKTRQDIINMRKDPFWRKREYKPKFSQLRRDAEFDQRNKKFFNPKTAISALKELVRIHKQGLQLKYERSYSEDYSHPYISEIAIPAKNGVFFKKGALVTPEQDAKAAQAFEGKLVFDHAMVASQLKDKSLLVKLRKIDKIKLAAETRPRDVATLALSINLPYWGELPNIEEERRFMTWASRPPKSFIDVAGFARTYAKFAGLSNQLEFVKQVEQWYRRLHSNHWDHAADHM